MLRATPPAIVLALLWTPAWSALPFATAPVERAPVPVQVVLSGTVAAVNRATVSAQIAATVEAVEYDVEDYVEKGAVLVRFRDRRLRAAFEQAQAGAAEAGALAEAARREQARVAGVFSRKLVSQAQMDQANANLEAAEARLERARAALAEAREQLGYAIVRAPYSGIVTERHVQVGETTSVGTPLMSGLSLDELRVEVQVPQSRVAAVRAAGRAQVLLDDGDRLHSEDLVFFPIADPRSNTFEVRVNLHDVAGRLLPGMFVKVAFDAGNAEQLLVPGEAIVYRSELTAVYVVDEAQRVWLRQVRLGPPAGDRRVVHAGLREGERVALDPVAAGVYLKSAAGRP